MTPKEKAETLVYKFQNSIEYVYLPESISIQCALIAVNLLMEEAYRQHDYEGFISYWKEVKQEINNL
jgi:hypothetical protein